MYPILFEFGIVTVFSLWFFIASGFVIGSVIFVRIAKRLRLRLDLLSNHSLLLFIWTLVISRIVFIATHPDFYFYRFHMGAIKNFFAIWDKGFSFWGAVFAWLIGLWYFAHREKDTDTFLKLSDAMIPALFIGMFFGNIGAFLDGSNYGTPTSLPWGIVFRNANVKYITAIHPTQLYSALYCLAIGLGMLRVVSRLNAKLPGLVSELGIFLFSLFKFFEEFIRGDDTLQLFFIRVPQMMAFGGIVVGGYLLWRRYTNKAGNDQERKFKSYVDSVIRRKGPEVNAATRSLFQNQTV